MPYSTTDKNLRMTATRDRLNSGSLELLDGAGVVIASAPLNASSGTVNNGVLTLAGFPKTVSAAAAGTVASARFRSSVPDLVRDGITVSLSGGGGQVIVGPALTFNVGDQVQFLASPTITHG